MNALKLLQVQAGHIFSPCNWRKQKHKGDDIFFPIWIPPSPPPLVSKLQCRLSCCFHIVTKPTPSPGPSSSVSVSFILFSYISSCNFKAKFFFRSLVIYYEKLAPKKWKKKNFFFSIFMNYYVLIDHVKPTKQFWRFFSFLRSSKIMHKKDQNYVFWSGFQTII